MVRTVLLRVLRNCNAADGTSKANDASPRDTSKMYHHQEMRATAGDAGNTGRTALAAPTTIILSHATCSAGHTEQKTKTIVGGAVNTLDASAHLEPDDAVNPPPDGVVTAPLDGAVIIRPEWTMYRDPGCAHAWVLHTRTGE